MGEEREPIGPVWCEYCKEMTEHSRVIPTDGKYSWWECQECGTREQ